jgi:hypothetical protein
MKRFLINTSHNKGLAKVAVQCSAVRQLAEVNDPLASGIRINPPEADAEKTALRQSSKR